MKRLYYLLLIFLTSYYTHDSYATIKTQKAPVTIFVHGTLYPLLDVLVHKFDVPLGLTPARVQGNKLYMGKIPYILHEALPEQFPLDTSYLFGWSGKLSFAERKAAAFDLYCHIKKFTGHPITLITHSHGGNVALNLPAVAQEQGDTQFCIDRLILLANPVQVVTERFVSWPAFKQVFSFYSRGDRTQIMDPEGLYRQWGRAAAVQRKIFSRRTFCPAPNLIQIGTVIHGKRPCHLDFISPRFLRHLPFILNFVPKQTKQVCYKSKESHFAIYLPRCSCQYYRFGHVCQLAY